MICSGCGKDIPFNGEVCPYCQRNKQGDQVQQVLAFIFGIAGGFTGYFIGGFLGAIAGFVIGVIGGIIIARKSAASKSQPPEVRLAPNQKISAKVEVTNSTSLGRKGVAQEIEKLGQLFLAGVITSEEFERGKTLFLGAAPDKAASAVELLQNLSALKQKGVLSQSEFNMKKWEILSERLIPGKPQAASLTQKAVPSSKPLIPVPALVPVQAEPEKVIACPHCQKHIPVRIVQVGMNYCPKCGGKFEAE